MKSTTKKEIHWSKPDTKEVLFSIPVGADVEIGFNKDRLNVTYNNVTKQSLARYAHTKFTGFTSEPSLNTMEKWMDNGIARSITGKKVEPDGFGPDGSPSWLLILGMI